MIRIPNETFIKLSPYTSLKRNALKKEPSRKNSKKKVFKMNDKNKKRNCFGASKKGKSIKYEYSIIGFVRKKGI